MPVAFDVAIVGGGASGVLAAIHLLRAARHPLRLIMFEKAERIGEGIAYGTHREEHVLNVTAGRMSAFEDDPSHFVRYLQTQSSTSSPEAVSQSFAERKRYALYLRATLDEVHRRSQATLTTVHEEVVALESGEPANLISRFCRATTARKVILALGNWPRKLPVDATATSDARPTVQAWDTRSVAAIGSDETVVIVGAGLSMIDTLLTLAANKHRGAIHVISRHALFPLPHARHGSAAINIEVLTQLRLSRRIALLRMAANDLLAQGEPWQWVMDRVRPFITPLWRSLDAAEQRRFLRHGVRYWDVHRHRIAPSVSDVVLTLRRAGQVIAHSGNVDRIDYEGDIKRVSIRPRGGASRTTTVLADRVVSCIGMQQDVRKVGDALVQSMLDRGLARSGVHGIGLDTAADGALISRDGDRQPNLFTLGSARVGQLWESIAIPELRVQAAELAKQLSEVPAQV